MKYEWATAAGECYSCGAYVPQLARFAGHRDGHECDCACSACRRRAYWLCDECMDLEEGD